jgi:hypothetical protein
MARHDGHVLQMTFAAFIADGAIMRMIDHESFYIAGAKAMGFRRFDGNAESVGDGFQARHDQLAFLVVFIFVFDDGALPAGANRMESGMPAKIRQVKAEGQAGGQQILATVGFISLIVYE